MAQRSFALLWKPFLKIRAKRLACPHCILERLEIKFKRSGWLSKIIVFWHPHNRCKLSTSTTFNG